ncbi:hypothetical protein DL98DRAFT_592564 [Cadophora sp. DSE1049]|nr:hypothetical protein DL98DRAFT_592564 [Cadophora sp. DSE1049]
MRLDGFGSHTHKDRDYNDAQLDAVYNHASLPIVEWLLKAGANPNTRHPEDGHVLRIAAGFSDLEITQLLFSFSADANSQDDREGGVSLTSDSILKACLGSIARRLDRRNRQ